MRVRFWGVRGSVPWATPHSIGHGCNTPCIEVEDQATGAFLILDAGSGIVGLGHRLGTTPRPMPILLTHYHWDHTQGLPFFAPLYMPGWTPSIWAPRLEGVSVEWVGTIFDAPYFPVPFHAAAEPAAADAGGAGPPGDRGLPDHRPAASSSRWRVGLPAARTDAAISFMRQTTSLVTRQRTNAWRPSARARQQ